MEFQEIGINYPLLSTEGETSDALNYNVGSTWTKIYALPGHTGFTSHFIKYPETSLNIHSAIFRVVFQSSDSSIPSARIISFSYDANNNGVWENDWGTFTRRNAYNPDNQSINVTEKLTNLLNTNNTNIQISIEVFGQGVIHEATLEVVYKIPDYSAEIELLRNDYNSLLERVESLEINSPITIQIPSDGFRIKFN